MNETPLAAEYGSNHEMAIRTSADYKRFGTSPVKTAFWHLDELDQVKAKIFQLEQQKEKQPFKFNMIRLPDYRPDSFQHNRMKELHIGLARRRQNIYEKLESQAFPISEGVDPPASKISEAIRIDLPKYQKATCRFTRYSNLLERYDQTKSPTILNDGWMINLRKTKEKHMSKDEPINYFKRTGNDYDNKVEKVDVSTDIKKLAVILKDNVELVEKNLNFSMRSLVYVMKDFMKYYDQREKLCDQHNELIDKYGLAKKSEEDEEEDE